MTRRLRLAADHGYTLVAVMLMMLATGILATATFAAVGADIPFTRASQDRKQAYAAAEAGLEYYLYQLTRDNDYWKTCDTAPGPDGQENPVNQKLPGDGRRWRDVTGTTDSRFSVELLPAPGKDKCLVSTPAQPTLADDTMIDKDTGTFRIRATGESRGVRRSIVTTFRRNSFLDFIYFTDYEALDPLTFTSDADRTYARNNCVKYRDDRDLNSWCRSNVNITFPNWDRINGPLHTNDDSLLTCGSPVFGRAGRHDAIEVVGNTPPAWRSGCAGTPVFNGVVRQPWEHLDVPPSNERLKEAALPGYLFHGLTTIVLKDTVMDVTTRNPANISQQLTYTNLALPPNGVIFVEKVGTCSIESPVRIRYNAGNGCAVLSVRGSYAKSLTLGSRDDILINGNVTMTANSDSVLGLISQRFVRVMHGVNDSCGSNIAAQTMTNVTIEAAILALNDSFIVDNWQCGSPTDPAPRQGRDRPALPRAGRHLLGLHALDRLPEGLRVRRPPALPQPAVLRRAGQGVLEGRPQQRAAPGRRVSIASRRPK